MRSLRDHSWWLLSLLVLAFASASMAGEEKVAVIRVDGMTCGSCAAGLESMLGSLAGVERAQVRFSDGKAIVRFDPGVVDTDALVASIRSAGYKAEFLPDAEEVLGETATGVSSCQGEAGADTGADGALSDSELARVVDFLVEQLVAPGDSVRSISRVIIAENTGVAVPDSELGRLQTAVIAKLQAEHPELLAQLEPGRCAEYGACSLQGNLSGATGELLAMYEREKRQDGRLYDDFPLPAFEAKDREGAVVHSTDLRGRRTLLVLLAGHCNHCHDSLPILQEVHATWGNGELRIVGVLVNSGSVESVNAWMEKVAPAHEIWIYEDESLGDLVDSHLVPTYLFIDPDGNVVEKLVGFKEKGQILQKVASFLQKGDSLDVRKVARDSR